MKLQTITNIIYLVLCCVSIISAVIVTCKSYKAKKLSKDESNQLDNNNFFISMLDKMVEYLGNAEKVYAAFKGKTKDYGKMKLNDVLTKIQSDYIASGKVFNKDEWTNIISKVVSMTKVVNNDECISK